MLCLELERDGLPVDRRAAERPHRRGRPARARTTRRDAERIRRRARPRRVLRHAPGRERTDLRNPAQVRDLLAAVGVDVPDTRAWRLEPFRDDPPARRRAAALAQGRADRDDVRLRLARRARRRRRPAPRRVDRLRRRGRADDGPERPAQPARRRCARRSCAEPGHVFVRADLGQIEPRVLAAVSGDRAFAEATRGRRPLRAGRRRSSASSARSAKVAVLAAMYGQRSGAAGEALGDLERAYPVAMGLPRRRLRRRAWPRRAAAHLRRPADPDRERCDADVPAGPGDDGAGRGRFARNAVIQGSAAELFKAWAATVRPRRRRWAPRSCCACTTSCSCTRRSERADEAADAGRALPGRQRPPVGGHRGRPVRRRHHRHPALVRRQVGKVRRSRSRRCSRPCPCRPRRRP